MKRIINQLEKIKNAKAGDTKEDFREQVAELDQMILELLDQSGFVSKQDHSIELFEPADVRMEKVQARRQLQENFPEAVFVDAVCGGIKRIQSQIREQFNMFTEVSYNCLRRVFEVRLAVNLWGTTGIWKPSDSDRFQKLLNRWAKHGLSFEWREKKTGKTLDLFDTENNRKILKDAFETMFQVHWLQYTVSDNIITEIQMTIYPHFVAFFCNQSTEMPAIPSKKLSKDDVYQMAQEISKVKAAFTMLAYDAQNQNLYLDVIRMHVANIEKLFDMRDLEISSALDEEYRAEREKNLKARQMEEQLKDDMVKLLKDRDFGKSILDSFSSFLQKNIPVLHLAEFSIQGHNDVCFTLEADKLPKRTPYTGPLVCVHSERGRFYSIVFQENNIRQVEAILKTVLQSVELVSAEADFRQQTSVVERICFRLMDPGDFQKLVSTESEKEQEV